MEEILQSLATEYTAEDGLVRFDLQDDRDPFPGYSERTVKNQNGILNLAETLMAFHCNGVDVTPFKDTVIRTIRKLQVPGTGCFKRNQGNDVFMDSHDNSRGIILAALLVGAMDIVEEFHRWGDKHGWTYNNLDPFNVLDPRAQRQGMDIAIYNVANGNIPWLINSVWLVGDCLFFSDMRPLKIRLTILEIANRIYANEFKKLEVIIRLIYEMKGGDEKYIQVISGYFQDPAHPVRRVWGLVDSRPK